jgi:hypothetical protein
MSNIVRTTNDERRTTNDELRATSYERREVSSFEFQVVVFLHPPHSCWEEDDGREGGWILAALMYRRAKPILSILTLEGTLTGFCIA